MRTTTALITISLLLVACSGGSTPEAAFETMKARAAARDWGGFYDLIAPSVRKQAEAKWEVSKKELDTDAGRMVTTGLGLDPEKVSQMSLREFFVALIGKRTEMSDGQPGQLTAFANAVITDKKVEGDRATILYKTGDREEELKMAKEGGSWYLGGEILGDMPGGE